MGEKKDMADFVRGIKAGIVSGIIYGIISAILGLLIIMVYWQTLMGGLGVFFMGTDMMAVFMFMLPSLFIGAIVAGIIGGIIFGLIYAAIYNSLPGSTSVMKGIVLSLLFWIIFSLALGYTSMTVYGMEYFAVNNVVIGLITSVIWGFLLGKFWDKFAPAKA